MHSEAEKNQRLAWEANRFFNKGKLPDPFTCERLRKGGEQGKLSDPLNAHLVLARLACLERQPQKMRGHHLSIINLTPDRPKSHIDYAASLRHLGFFSEALERVRIANELLPNDGALLQHLVRGCMLAGRFREAALVMDRCFDLDRQVSIRQYHFIREALELVQRERIDDETLERLQKACMTFLHQRDIYISGSLRAPAVQMELIQPGEMTMMPGGAQLTRLFLRWGLQLDLAKEEIGALNAELAEHLKQDGLDPALFSIIRLRLMPWSTGTHGQNVFFS